ncbi:MAG TPA: hypothetical protein VH079_14080, partial [Terriglobales bacterium]|nr:hypothetical protein [Terriglobales bacterium]
RNDKGEGALRIEMLRDRLLRIQMTIRGLCGLVCIEWSRISQALGLSLNPMSRTGGETRDTRPSLVKSGEKILVMP